MRIRIDEVAAFEPGAPLPPGFALGSASDLALYGGVPGRLILPFNRGFRVYDLAVPMKPRPVDSLNLYNIIGDGGDAQKWLASVSAAQDGSRIVVGWLLAPWGSLVSPGPGFNVVLGDFGPDKGECVVDQRNGKTMAYAVKPSGVWAADITSLPPAPLTPKNVPSTKVIGTPVLQAVTRPVLVGGRILYGGGSHIVAVDVRGAVPSVSITTVQILGLQGIVKSVSAAVHPDGRLLAIVEASNGNRSSGVRLLEVDGGMFSILGKAAVAVPYVVPQVASCALPWRNDVVYVAFEQSADDANDLRLCAYSANLFGIDVGGDTFNRLTPPWHSSSGPLGGLRAMRLLDTGDGFLYAYLASTNSAFAIRLKVTT